ncbi:circadian associated repressor of transcription a [Gadus morhua]|uniref:circadian associated repressor of transcription a n=1 Tax=Gadus morhua TaxID=8049 RepID=UPI0011B36D2D|nr:circadian-associated transcriptional repressor-like [Gadus morhua]
MNSLSTSSKWPSYDSLSSTPSLLLSESEHTEDEADLLSSEGEGESRGGSVLYLAGRGTGASVVGFPFPGHPSDKQCRKSCPVEASLPAKGPSPGAVTLGSSSVSPGDTAFAQKCADLQKFVRPLIELLNGLKRGRFEKGLTGFQQSVAIDRLQRILGILQKPDMGEKYLQTIVQVEILLRMWFPQIKPQSSITPTNERVVLGPSRWRQNQLHIPVKKRKMSWLNPDPSDTIWPQHQQAKRHQSGDLVDCCHTVTSNNVISTRLPGTSSQKRVKEEIKSGLPACELLDIVDRRHSSSRRENRTWRRLQNSPPPSLRSNPATQDGSVSSSSAIPTADSP